MRLLTAYADNVIISGPLSQVTEAVDTYRDSMANIGLQLNPAESEAFIPSGLNFQFPSHANLRLTQEGAVEAITSNRIVIPVRQDGIKVLGCPLGSSQFCAEIMQKTAVKIEKDIELLLQFPHKHQRIKLATF